jgi:hypothetical protein
MIPTIGQSDVCLQWQTTTNTTTANHGRHRWKWPPSAPHEALRPAPRHQMDGRQPPKQVDISFGGVEGVYGPKNTAMLWRCIIARTKEHFKGHTDPQSETIARQAKNMKSHLGHGSAMIIDQDMFCRRLLDKKHPYLKACHFCSKILQQFFYFRISKYICKNYPNSSIAPTLNWRSLYLNF